MALMPYLDEREASPEVLKILQRPLVLNVQRMTAHAQQLLIMLQIFNVSRSKIKKWRVEYDRERAHSSLGT